MGRRTTRFAHSHPRQRKMPTTHRGEHAWRTDGSEGQWVLAVACSHTTITESLFKYQ